MSHGTKGDIIHTKDGCYNINDTVLSPLLRNETLKPIQKLIIINACRTGNMESELVQVPPLRLPENLTIMYSAAKDRESYLFKSGALFIQKFCEDFGKPFTVYSLVNIFERLKMKLSIEMESSKVMDYYSNNEEDGIIKMQYKNFGMFKNQLLEIQNIVLNLNNDIVLSRRDLSSLE
ncbi:uncharacterized protein LOC119674395 [Teleopsis dalmanni]|uniref:uncharacterized protein LOC119674395 n=1 Tax=Teleopsis dalmanni TaxID=139649 RepID=UPI0018CE8BF3|nr:uncharacterized protein LOC119674395 [Teleopsis dalmanni]